MIFCWVHAGEVHILLSGLTDGLLFCVPSNSFFPFTSFSFLCVSCVSLVFVVFHLLFLLLLLFGLCILNLFAALHIPGLSVLFIFARDVLSAFIPGFSALLF